MFFKIVLHIYPSIFNPNRVVDFDNADSITVVIQVTCFPSEPCSQHSEEKPFMNAHSSLQLTPRKELASTEDFTALHPRPVRLHAVVLTPLPCPYPGLCFEQFKWGQEKANLVTWAGGKFA